ncbi:MAG: sulfotransferase, partial [Candidatus Hydrogenedentota bacterium]
MKRPNFIIVGAPKCGTTALSEYLRAHPNVFVSDPKEPHYFAEDFDLLRITKTEAAYHQLFAKATSEHAAVGEASTGY